MGDYLADWESDWESRQQQDPGKIERAWMLRERGWSYAEIAADARVSLAEAYRLVTLREKYRETQEPVMSVAHEMTSINFHVAHAVRHTKAALASDGEKRQFNLEHVDRHLESASEHADRLQQVIRHHFPKIGAEYEKTAAAMHMDSG